MKKIIQIIILSFFFFLAFGCGGVKKHKEIYKKSSSTELIDKSKIDESEASNSNVKKTETTKVDDKNQTIEVEEVNEPIDPTKEEIGRASCRERVF